MKPKIITIVGPTASGKTALSIKIAKRFNGEIVSADSRQVYKGMDIGAGKVPKDRPNIKLIKPNTKRIFTKNSDSFVYYSSGIAHYLLDVASPKKQFTAIQYKKLAEKAIRKILRRKKIPIICGGTGFYIQTVTENISIPKVRPDAKLRAALEKKSLKELFSQLKKLDPRRTKNIDKNNRRRLIRALEIVIKSGKKVPILKSEPRYETLFIGIKQPIKELKQLIKTRLLKRLKQGMVKEVINLKKSGLSWKRLEDFGLEYRFVAYYLQNKISYGEMVEKLQKEIEHYAKRQMTWFRKIQNVNWIKNQKEAEKLVSRFLD